MDTPILRKKKLYADSMLFDSCWMLLRQDWIRTSHRNMTFWYSHHLLVCQNIPLRFSVYCFAFFAITGKSAKDVPYVSICSNMFFPCQVFPRLFFVVLPFGLTIQNKSHFVQIPSNSYYLLMLG